MSKVTRHPDGSFSLPYVILADSATTFVDAAYESGWVIREFDWPEWAHTPAARRLQGEGDTLANATQEEIAQLLTVVIRRDRFSEGALLADFESGLILRIVRRIDVLLNAMQS